MCNTQSFKVWICMTENVNRSAMFLSTKHNIILNIAHLLCGKNPSVHNISGMGRILHMVQPQPITCVIEH